MGANEFWYFAMGVFMGFVAAMVIICCAMGDK